ncbi:hypothetical protein [Aquipseudomonas campi]
MCNAWNHPAHCPCGWGGIGHSGGGGNKQSSLFYFWPSGVPPISASLSSFTIPNASCPVCGESVFYYCNSYGSSVFFDELGPPWPKHPCTDNSTKNLPKPFRSLPSNGHASASAKWQKDGWELFQLDGLTEIDRKTFRLQLSSSSTTPRLTLYVLRKYLANAAGTMHIFPENLGIFTSSLGNGKYRVSALTENLTPIKFEAYDSRIGLHDSPKQKQPKHVKKPLNKPKPRKQKKHTKIPAPTSLSLAFEKATVKNSKSTYTE